jgi:predicted dehydrogenase
MLLTPERRDIGRRNFLKALAGTPALATLAPPPMAASGSGGPVRLGFVGVGGQGRALLGSVNPASARVVAMADINPDSLARADEVLARRQQPGATHYVEWREMLEHEPIEAVVIAVPLSAHADIAASCLEAGAHVLCEKMMAWDVAGAERMQTAAVRAKRVLEIGYQRNYNPLYRAAYDGIMRRKLLGDVYHVRLAWHRNGNWRRTGAPPSPNYDPGRWGYSTFEHLLNWRLYWRYSRGLFAELCSHQLNAASWFLDLGVPAAVHGSGGVYRYKDGREAHDHVFAMFEFPEGVTAMFSSIESNADDQRYEAFFGTKGTLIMYNEREALLFEEGADRRETAVEVSGTSAGAVVEISETKRSNNAAAAPAGSGGAPTVGEQGSALELEISGFCAAIRDGRPLACGAERALETSRACIAACEAAKQKTRLTI